MAEQGTQREPSVCELNPYINVSSWTCRRQGKASTLKRRRGKPQNNAREKKKQDEKKNRRRGKKANKAREDSNIDPTVPQTKSLGVREWYILE